VGNRPHAARRQIQWFNLLWLVPIGFVLLVAGVVVAQALRELPPVQAFIEKYPGNIPPPNGEQGIPVWANWQHFGAPVGGGLPRALHYRDGGVHLCDARRGTGKVALGVIFLDVILYSAGGVIGTMHHLYFSGTPVEHMALGAFFSAAEVIPLTFLTVEAWSFLQLGSRQEKRSVGGPFPHR